MWDPKACQGCKRISHLFIQKILNKLKKDLTLLLKVLYNNICSEKTAEHLIGVVGIEPQSYDCQDHLFYRLNYYPIFRLIWTKSLKLNSSVTQY